MYKSAKIKVLELTANCGVVTNEIVGIRCFKNSEHREKSARRLTMQMSKDRLLTFRIHKRGVGRGVKLFSINKKRYAEIRKLLGIEKIVSFKTGYNTEHQLFVNLVIANILYSCELSKIYSCEYLTDLEGFNSRNQVGKTISETTYLPYEGRSRYTPDSVLILMNSKTLKRGLQFIELDTGSTTLRKIGGKMKNVQNKLQSYNELWRSKEYKRYNEYINYSFKGFRLLWITLTQKRLDAVSDLCLEEQMGDL